MGLRYLRWLEGLALALGGHWHTTERKHFLDIPVRLIV